MTDDAVRYVRSGNGQATIVTVHEFSSRRSNSLVPFGRVGHRDPIEEKEVDAICKAAEAPGGQTPGASLASWLRQLFAFFASKRHIASELLKHTDTSPVFGSGRARVIAVGQPLLAAAQRAGEIRDDLAIEQVLDTIHAIATIDGDASYVEPILQTALDGLRPRTK